MLRPVNSKSRTTAVPHVALEPRNASKARYQSQPQLRKTETRHFIRHDQIAKQRQLESAAESNPVHCRNRRERSRINRVSHAVNSLNELAHARNPLGWRQRLRPMIQLAQISPGAKSLRDAGWK